MIYSSVANGVITDKDVYSATISMNTVREHEGLRCFTTFHLPDDMFGVIITEYDYLDTSDNDKCYLRTQFHVPKKYAGKYRNRVIAMLKTSEDVELTDENKTYSYISGNRPSYCDAFFGFSLSKPNFEDDLISHVRFVIDLLDDDDAVIRSIYSSQVTIADNGSVISNKMYEADDDCIVQGYLCVSQERTQGVTYQDVNQTFPLAYGVKLSGANYKAPNGLSNLIPWNIFQSVGTKVFPVLRVGTDKFIYGESVMICPPDFTVKSAVQSGQTFMLDGLWYTATANLAVGDTLVLGTNCQAAEQVVI